MNNYFNESFELENLYPEIYKDLYPFVADSVNNFLRRGFPITDEAVNSSVDDIIRTAGLWDEDDGGDAVAVSLDMRRPPVRRRPVRRHHNRNSLRDLLRILYLRELANRRR